MSKYTDMALTRRAQFGPDGRPVYNCCQAVATVFAEDAGYDETAAMKAATFFRGGMQIGSVCGAVTGGLIALGLAGLDAPGVSAAFLQKVKANHDSMICCRDLLKVSAERGEVKLTHCNGLICECVGYVEEALRENGKIE